MEVTGMCGKKACCVDRRVQQDCLSQWHYWYRLSNQKLFRQIYYFLAMEGKTFDVRLVPEFIRAAIDMPIVEWIENVELVCELCTMKNVERVLPLRLRRGALAIYRQISPEQKVDAEQIKQALINTYATDAFNAYDQFVTWQLRPEKVDDFFAELPRLARLVGGPLPERWLTCAFVSGLPQHVKHLLQA